MDISTISYEDIDKYETELLKKIRNNESFTEEEIVSLFDMLDEVDEKRYNKDDWYIPIQTIFEVKDTYIMLEWDEDVTGWQNNSYNSAPYEVYYKEKTIIVKEWYPKEN